MPPAVFTLACLPPADPRIRRYGILGFPVSHSLSPPMQEAGFQALGIPVEYLRLEVPAGGLKSALPLLRSAGFLGWNCTLPHKETMFALCDETDEAAQESGSVNTVVVSAGGLQGHSTDADGWEDAVQEAWSLDLRTQRVHLLGCGGVGRTLAFRLARRGCRELFLSNRNAPKATRLAAELRSRSSVPVSVVPWEPGPLTEATHRADLLLQATPLGIDAHDPLPIPEPALHSGLKVFDTVYHRTHTPLVRLARKKGLAATDGLGMLLHQGIRALSIWTGKPAPRTEMRIALEKAAGRPV